MICLDISLMDSNYILYKERVRLTLETLTFFCRLTMCLTFEA